MQIRSLAIAAFILSIASIGANAAQSYTLGALRIDTPWSRATPAGVKVAAGYMTITNTGSTTDALIGGSFARSGSVQVHEMTLNGNIMQMRELAGGLEIRPGQKVELKPGGFHVMFVDLKQPLLEGDTVKGQLTFRKAGTIDVEFAVGTIGALGPSGQGNMNQGAMEHMH